MEAFHRGNHDATMVVYDDFERDEVPLAYFFVAPKSSRLWSSSPWICAAEGSWMLGLVPAATRWRCRTEAWR